MNLIQLLSLLLPSYPKQSADDTREVLRDYPGCGQLGDISKKECYWSCDWGHNPLYGLNETGILALIEDKIGHISIVGEKAASCLLQGFIKSPAINFDFDLTTWLATLDLTTLDLTNFDLTNLKQEIVDLTNLPQEIVESPELLIIKLFYELIKEIGAWTGPSSVKSPECLKNCESIKVCAEFTAGVTNFYNEIQMSTNISILSIIYTNITNQFPLNENIYGPDCVSELEQKKDDLLTSGLISRIVEELPFHVCLLSSQIQK